MENTFSSLEEAGLRVIESMTTPTRPGKEPRPVFIVAGKTAGFEETFRDLGGRKFRGQWSFWSNPSDELFAAIKKFGRQTFAEQIEARVERKLDKAERYGDYFDNAESRAQAATRVADGIARHIPMGQPILVGHHSERRHRRDLDRIDSQMRKSIEESKKADYFSTKAANLERDAERMLKDRSYLMNRIEEAEVYLRRLERHAREYSDYTARVIETEEKLNYWKGQLAAVEAAQKESGRRVASAKNVKVGFVVNYCGKWYEVVRVSKKSVTINNWLDVPTFTYRLRYADLRDFRDPKAASANSADQQKAVLATEIVENRGVQ